MLKELMSFYQETSVGQIYLGNLYVDDLNFG